MGTEEEQYEVMECRIDSLMHLLKGLQAKVLHRNINASEAFTYLGDLLSTASQNLRIPFDDPEDVKKHLQKNLLLHKEKMNKKEENELLSLRKKHLKHRKSTSKLTTEGFFLKVNGGF